MPTSPLFPLPDGLEMTAMHETSDAVHIQVTSSRPHSLCPSCATASTAVHSTYRRQPRDLPCTGRPIRLVLTVRKFFCRTPDCPYTIFTERLPDFLACSSRLTNRLRTAVQELGFTAGGKGGERLSAQLGMPTSDATVLWSLFLVPEPEQPPVQVVGVDDWSWRRGRRFGSIFVNLETHRIVDMQAERDAEQVQQWLAAHPEVTIVSRDRGGTYLDGATRGAPQAIQVADRWHLLANLGDAVEAFLIRAQIRLPASSEVAQTPVSPLAPLPPSFSATPASQQRAATRLRHKWHLAQQVQELHQTGMGLRHIGEVLGLARNTVRTYLQLTAPLSPTPRPLRPSRLDPHEDYVRERWQQGERNAAQLYRDLYGRGYRGSATMVRAYVAHLRATVPGELPRSRRARAQAGSPRVLRWLLASPLDRLTREDLVRRECLVQSSPEMATLASLLHRFQEMVRERRHADLRPWMQAALSSGIAELQRFVGGIERDYDAVHAALCFPWSQGITEGKINKLKTLKRSMYGRAGMALLRQRLLHDA